MEENQNPTQQPVPVVSATTPVPTSLTSNPPPIAKKSAKFSIKAIIGTIIFLILAGGAAAGFVYREPILKLVSNPTPTPAVSISPTPTPDPTANWKQFSNLGISFMYPVNLTVIENVYFTENPEWKKQDIVTNMKLSNKDLQLTITVAKNVKDRTPNDALGNGPSLSYIRDLLKSKEIKTLSIASRSAQAVYNLPVGQAADMSDVVFLKNGHFFQATFTPSSKSNIETVEKILSTLTFDIPNPPIDISTWKTHTFSSLPGQIKFPFNLTSSEGTTKDESQIRFNNNQDGFECINIQLWVKHMDNSKSLREWILDKYPTSYGMPGSAITLPPTQINSYTNSIDPSIQGYWIKTGAETEGQDTIIMKGNTIFEFRNPGCAAGDSYIYHPYTSSVIENMIPTLKLTAP